ncbi:hypothetical protein STEG23_021586 [Scotinomys teguina]
MDWLGQRTHCGPNVAAPNPRQPYLGDFMADGLDQLTLCSQSPGFGTPAAPVQGHPKSVLSCRHRWPGRLFSLANNLALSLRCRRRFQEAPLSRDFTADGLDHLTLCSQSPGFGTQAAPVQVVAPGDSDGGDFTADGLDQLTLCSQSPGFGTPAAPVQGHPKSVLSCRHRWPGRLFSLPNNLALSLRCRRRFQEAPLSRDFTADGLDQLTLCSQSPGFGTPAAPVQVRQHSRPPRSSRTVSTSAQLELCSLPEANCHSGSVPLVCRTCPQVSGSKVSHRRYCLTSCLRPVAMGNILQRSSPEVKNLTQFSLLKGLRNYLPSQVERVLRASASLWPFDNRPWSLSPRSPISNQDAQQELDTTPKSLEYLTINKAKTDLAVQRQLPQPTPKLKCRESHGKPGKNSRGVKIPDSGSGDSRCNHTGAEETTDSQVTSDHIKELSQDKRKGSLSVEVPETMKNTLSRDSMRSTFHPVIRKRPGSSFVPRPEKEKRSLDMSLLLEECVDCCALCSGLAARSSGSRAGDAKPKMRRNDAVPTGTSSSQQRGLVTRISLTGNIQLYRKCRSNVHS